MMEWSQSSQEQHDPFTWFKESQLQSVFRNGAVPDWFHGIISRKTAEELLMSKPPGYFLIRVSESRIGYTLSYQADKRCRHFMIDPLMAGQYMIVGENRRHRSLQDLVEFHRRNPIMPFNQVLTVPCGQASNSYADYAQIQFPNKHLASNSDSPTKEPPQPSLSQPEPEPEPEDEIPPALPFRPNDLRDSTVLLPNSRLSRLYPSLELEFPHVASLPPISPVAKSRKRLEVNDLPSHQPPELPTRSRAPPKQNQACNKPICTPKSLFVPMAPERNISTNAPPGKHHEWKPTVVSNLMSLKKKFQKKTNQPQDVTNSENVYSEISDGPDERCDVADNEYQEITGLQNLGSPPRDRTVIEQNHPVLPQEYHPPPPFAPGY
ncbi:hematopoietic SH2 domain-containing protein homolog [Austrofundulus limnaeus]|uniref:Hematopoietic SH2 domain-containing protein homolog n=1 Tax=Austrofundulus limnaeus TaxID=52670 RepID=A0A2I4BPE0_AUSLI|nr:PREDICTED: hematopoietic SH2 domain-containing protein [Austrofundulus limnaeus]